MRERECAREIKGERERGRERERERERESPSCPFMVKVLQKSGL